LIAATLEKRWNKAAQRLHDLEGEPAAFERGVMRTITAEQKCHILQLASDFPRLWGASTTAPHDRKRIVRLLVRDITVTKGPGVRNLRLNVRWQGAETEILQVKLPPHPHCAAFSSKQSIFAHTLLRHLKGRNPHG
jgi:hypothetical protein